jgi:hypothetical protein
MHLSDDMRAELEQRLTRIALEQHDDPAFQDLPATDVVWLLAFVVLSIVGTVWLQAG